MRDGTLRIIVTAVGAPGASTFLRYLRKGLEQDGRRHELIGIDMDPEAVGRFLTDRFYTAPAAASEEYFPFVKDLCEREKPDVFYCVSSFEVPSVSRNAHVLRDMGIRVIVSPADAVEVAENKYSLYSLFKNDDLVKVPEFRYPRNLSEFTAYAAELGYPERRIAFKPHVSKGSRGFRVIDDNISRKDLLLNYKPESVFMSMAEFTAIFEEEEEFPDFILMEFVEGEEIDAMVFSHGGKALMTTVKTREANRGGIVTKGEMVSRPEIEAACARIVEKVPLEFHSGIQFKGGKLIEINPRVSTFIYSDDFIEPYIAVRFALGEIGEKELSEMKNRIPMGVRFVRYMDQIFF